MPATIPPRAAQLLGSRAVRVWVALTGVANRSGETHTTTAGIAAKVGLSPTQTKRALARLRAAGLVVDRGWQVRSVKHDRSATCSLLGAHREVFVRWVWTGGEEPSKLGVWMTTANGHGGPRPGAGRKPRRTTDIGYEGNGNPMLPTSSEARPPAGAPVDPGQAEPWSVSPDDGAFIAGTRAPVVVPPGTLAQLPPFPGLSVVQPATIPPPPLLPDDVDDDRDVETLRTAYAVAHDAIVGGFAAGARGTLSPRARKALVAAAGAIREARVSPLRWAEFALRLWADGGALEQKRKAGSRARRRGAPMSYVWNATTIRKHSEWCRLECDRRGSTLVFTRSLRALLHRWQSAAGAVLRGAPLSDAMTRFLPGDTYDRLMRRAQEEAKHEQANIDARVASGENLWTSKRVGTRGAAA